MVVPTDPIRNHAAGVLRGFEPVAMHALVLERANYALDHPILLGAVGRDELLLQAVAFDQGRVAATGKYQAVIGPQQEWMLDLAQAPITRDQGLLQRRFSRLGSAAAAQVPTQQFTAVAVDHQGQRGPPIAPRPHPAQIRRPALIWRLGHRRQGLDSGPEAHRALAYLPAPDLEDALHGVLVEAKQMCHRPISKGRVLFDHGLDGLNQVFLDLWGRLGAAVIHRAPGNLEPLAKLHEADRNPVFSQSLLKAEDHFSSSLPSREASFFLARNSNIASP